MNDFEHKLQDALRRRESPDGFADRVMARIPRAPRRSLPRWLPAAAAVLIAIAGAGSYEYLQTQKQKQEAELARRELIYALEITNAKLSTTLARLSLGKGDGI